MKHINLKFLKGLIFILSAFSANTIYGNNIGGSAQITPASNNVYQLLGVSGAHDYTWTSNGNAVTLTNDHTSAVTVNVAKNTTSCTFVLTITYSTGTVPNAVEHQETTTIEVLPHINGPSVIFPGQSLTYNIQTVCTTYVFCTTPWNTTPASACSPCSNVSSQVVVCPASGFPNSISVGCDLNCTLQGGLTLPLDALNIPVKLRDPSPLNGPQQIGCSGTTNGNTVYSASPVTGAAFWVWTYPTYLFNAIGGVNGQALTLDAIEEGTGNITVQAFASSGSPVSSNIISIPVQVCCIGTRYVTANVASGSIDDREAGVSIIANNILVNGATGHYHAGADVTLNYGFAAQAGSTFHAYLAGCTHTFYRIMSNAAEDSLDSLTDENGSDYGAQELTQLSDLNSLSKNDISVFPNPTNGNLNIKVLISQNIMVSLQNVTGIVLLQEKMKAAVDYNQNQINLADFADGIYLLRIKDDKGNQIKTEKVIVQR